MISNPTQGEGAALGLVSAQEVLAFWFSPQVRPLWFRSTPAFDRELAARFMETYRAAAAGGLTDWDDSAQGALALVIVLDQFPLNMFRGTPASFATESAARRAADAAIAAGFDAELSDEQKAFLYMPYMHSEGLRDQDTSVQLYEAAGLSNNLKFARHHRDLIRRFGRFPHRNSILGRQSTREEIAYLNSKEAFRG